MKLKSFGVRLSFKVNEWDVPRGALVIVDGPQSPRDDESARKVTFSGRKRVGGRGGFQEESRGEISDVNPGPLVGRPRTYRARKTKTLVQTPA